MSPSQVTTAFYVTKKMTVDLYIADLAGRVVMRENAQCSAGKNLIKSNFTQFAMGTYLAALKTGKNIPAQSIVYKK